MRISLFFLITILAMNTLSCSNNTDHPHSETTLPVDRADFQTTINGKKTDLFVLQNNQGMKVAITNYGGRIVSWMAPDKNGDFDDIVLGFDNVKDYQTATEIYFGATIGRYANRIDAGQFTLKGEQYQLARNNGPNHLHGGPGGFHTVVWDAKQLDDHHLVLHYISEAGEEGYPGQLDVQVIFTLSQDNALKIDYTATTDKTTIVNLTNHAFYNLGGAASGPITNNELWINADAYTPIDSTSIPTGEIAEVEGTPFDFRDTSAIAAQMTEGNPQLQNGSGFDHNFVLNKDEKGTLTQAASVYDPESGRELSIATTEPGIQFYSGNFLNGTDVGKQGKSYKYRTALCLEPQHYPDSPNNPNFPSVVLQPDSIYHTLSIYRLSTR